MLRSAKCGRCRLPMPLSPALLEFTPAPREVTCRRCDAQIRTSFSYRATWMEFLLWKVLFLVTPIFLAVAWAFDSDRILGELWLSLAMSPIIGAIGGLILALIVAFPLQLAVELLRPLWIVFVKPVHTPSLHGADLDRLIQQDVAREQPAAGPQIRH